MLYLIFTLIILGIANAAYLYWQHRQFAKNNRPMVCPIGEKGKCHEVVDSKYGKTLGISNDLLGIVYYVVLTALLLINLYIFPGSFLLGRLILFLVSFSFLFTLYLLFVQAFILKKWCFWCLISAVINIVIFILNIFYFLIINH